MLQFLTRLIARYFERAMDRAWKCPSLSRPQDLALLTRAAERMVARIRLDSA